jgi:hypothetical protein
MKHLSEEQLTLIYFQEAAAEDSIHLDQCPACRAGYDRLALFLDSVRAVPVPDLDAGYERRLWSSIEPQVSGMLHRGRSRFGYWFGAPALAGLAVMLLAVAFLAGMYTQHRFTAQTAQSISPKASQRVLLIALGDHLDRSQIVLAELVNAPEGQAADISAQQQLAEHLVSENRLLRQTAAHSGDARDADVLDQLERVLLDIAHSPAQASSSEMDQLRERIEAEGLLFKVRVISTNAREKGMKL